MIGLKQSINVYRDISNIGFFSRLSLKFLSIIYRIAVGIRNWTFDRNLRKQFSLPGKTISVGNLVVGGTGKSPMVIALATDLLNKGFQPAIITRGHGSKLAKDDSMVLLNGETKISPVRSRRSNADEAMMQSRELPNVPVIIGVQRIKAVHRFLNQAPELAQQVTHWILDDGFQHRQLKRDVDIVLLDSSNPFGNGFLLPLGALREPIANISRSTLVVFTRSDDTVPLKNVVQHVTSYGVDLISYAPLRVDSPVLVQGKSLKSILDPSLNVAIVSAIARPERFIDSLKIFGITVNERYFLPDHWTFDQEKVRKIAAENDAVVTTAKDYWRDSSIFTNLQIPVYVLPIHFDIDPKILKDIEHALA